MQYLLANGYACVRSVVTLVDLCPDALESVEPSR